MSFSMSGTLIRCVVNAMTAFTFVAIAVAASATVAAQDIAPNTAQGSITVNSKKTEFRHAYAVTRPARIDKKAETVVIVSDKPLAANAVVDDIERMKVQRRDGLNLIEVKFDDRKTVVGTNFEVAPLVVSAFSTEFKMTVETCTDKVLKGRFNSVSNHKMRDNTYSFDVRFNATMTAPPSALSGKEAWDTPQGKVFAEYLRACRAGDKATIKRVVTDVVRKELDGPKGGELMKFLKEDSADPKTAKFVSLIVDGDIAKAEIGTGSSITRYQIHRVGQTWLVHEY